MRDYNVNFHSMRGYNVNFKINLPDLNKIYTSHTRFKKKRIIRCLPLYGLQHPLECSPPPPKLDSNGGFGGHQEQGNKPRPQ